MKLLVAALFLFNLSSSYAQEKIEVIGGVSYTNFIPIFEEEQDASKTTSIDIYTGVYDEENESQQLDYIQNLIKSDQKFYGKENVNFNALLIDDLQDHKNEYNKNFESKFSEYKNNILEQKVDSSQSDYQLLARETREPSQKVRFASKRFWVITRFITTTGASVLTMTLSPHTTMSLFHLFNSVLTATGSAGIMQYSDYYEQWLNTGKWENFLKNNSSLTKTKLMFKNLSQKVKKANPILSDYYKWIGETSGVSKITTTIKKFLSAQGESLSKWAWSEYLFVQVLIEGPKVIRSLFQGAATSMTALGGILGNSLAVSLKGSVSGIAIQMFGDMGIYANRNLEVRRLKRAVETGELVVDNADQFLKEAGHYIDSIDLKKDAAGKVIKIKKYNYNSEIAHPLMKKVYRRFYIRSTSLSLASITGAILTTLQPDSIPIYKSVAFYYSVFFSASGGAYYKQVLGLTKLFNERVKKNAKVLPSSYKKKESFINKARKRLKDQVQEFCNNNLRRFN